MMIFSVRLYKLTKLNLLDTKTEIVNVHDRYFSVKNKDHAKNE